MKAAPLLVGLSALLALLGIGAQGASVWARAMEILAVLTLSYAMGVGLNLALRRWPGFAGHPWRIWAATAVLMVGPMGLVTWGAEYLLASQPLRLADLPAYFRMSLVAAPLGCLTLGLMTAGVKPMEAEPAPPISFLDRLPPRLRGAELWAVEAEDHYLRLHTSLGQDLVLMNLSDAVAELRSVDGARVHRSWWVARNGIDRASRLNGRWTLLLLGGGKAPVSRRQVRALRERKWL